jgi:hypothetical protein
MNHALTASVLPRRQLAIAAILTVLAAMAVVVLFALKPSELWFLPACQFNRLTGLHCPGCGLTRATHHLLHGRVLTALHSNALFTLALGCTAVIGLWRWLRPASVPSWKPAYTWWLLVLIAVFGVVRNIPAYPFTLLAP